MRVGERVRVEGEFDGFGYETNSMRVVITGSEICNSRGAGSVIAELASDSDQTALSNVMPGTPVVLEGTITAIEESRFVTLTDATVP